MENKKQNVNWKFSLPLHCFLINRTEIDWRSENLSELFARKLFVLFSRSSSALEGEMATALLLNDCLVVER